MHHRVIRFLTLCLPAVLLLAGCGSADQPFDLAAGADAFPVPAQIGQTRDNVLEYVTSSSRVPEIPLSGDWLPDRTTRSQGEYHFRSGDWQMVVWPADTGREHQRVIILNQADHTCWWGYVERDGRVIDTAYSR